jgi:hypothetical protein
VAATILTAASGTPLKHRSSNSSDKTYITSLTAYVADYNCGADSNNHFPQFPGNITTDTCIQFHVDSYKIAALPDVHCTFTTYNGLGCLDGDKDAAHTYELEKGNGTVCAFGGVPDGGKWYHRSGFLTCG